MAAAERTTKQILVSRQAAMREVTGPIKLTEAQAQRLIKLYDAADLEIQKQLNRALLQGLSTSNLNALKKNVEIIRADLLKGSRTWCEEAVPQLYIVGLKSVDADLAAAGIDAVGGMGAIHQQAMQVLAENTYSRFEAVDNFIARHVDDIYREAQLDVIRGQVAGYNTWQQTAKIYRQQLADKGVTGFVDKLGRRWDMKTYVNMVARTAPREVMLQGTAMRILENGYDLVRLGSGVNKHTCDKCIKWAGQVVSLTGKTKGYQTLADARADGWGHPQCTHTYSIAISFDDYT